MNKEIFKPHVSSEENPEELSIRALFLGISLALIFGAANAFLGLKVGMTVSASIPAAVSSMAILRMFFKRVSILENNMVQTIASASEALAAGVIFTIPSFAFLGQSLPLWKVAMLSALGGVLGVLFMVPLRSYLIVEQHQKLPYPEGTACAEILKAGEKGGSQGFSVLCGAFLGVLHKMSMSVFHLFGESTRFVLGFYQNAVVGLEASSALLGVGFIIGPRYANLVVSGGFCAWLVFIPLIQFFAGQEAIDPMGSQALIHSFSAEQIWSKYMRYIGTGAIIVGGVIGMIEAVPVIFKAFHSLGHELFFAKKKGLDKKRVEKDLSISFIIIVCTLIIFCLYFFLDLGLGALSLLVLLFLGFFFVAVSSQIVGYVGSSVNPASGMIITTLLIVSLLFRILGWTEATYVFAAMATGSLVGMAVCVAADTSQDLKTGFLLGATPKKQQIGEIIGVVSGALVMGYVLYLLDQAYTLGSEKLSAPQATMMAMIVKGVMQGNIPYDLLLLGAFFGIVLLFCQIPVLPVAIGLYLPLSMTMPIFVGGLIASLVSKLSYLPQQARDRGVLVSSGFVAGDALMGVLTALFVVMSWVDADAPAIFSEQISLVVFFLVAVFLALFSLGKTWKKEL